MTNATTSPGPVAGNPYAVLVLTGGFSLERFNFPAPVDALVAAVRYLRAGRQVRLTDRTCDALKEWPDLDWVMDAMMEHAPARPVADVDSPLFRAAPGA